ncbi:cell envelope integrity protein TolA [Blochmannia endosymbiont of Camponotus sp. C-046]|uniref:cell envelope integrity protein TolA n=1 Tax=Blochmannia endosymbiont of Camponotus sp. C-046 TaxID=2945589 RepID=UPI002024E0E7|nr:cell envelope integrity protein TolA [Blochmannia endosymbiont of Camponotus sp. C-046]URJ28947.1 cell envelope integrity protein TolA [Blochmannia endosymbiont of Camponotus sp. C-046]
MISIIVHVIVSLLLYKHIIKKQQQYINKITDNKHSINAFIQNSNPKKENNNNIQDQTDRFKITETQRPLAGTTLSNPPAKKKNQNTIEKKLLIHDELNYHPSHESNELDNLLNALINQEKSTKKNNKTSTLNITTKKNNNENNISHEIIKNNEINTYKCMISESIQKKFYNSSHYTGKQCNLHIQLAPDGTLLSVTAISGDYELCQAAIIAAKLAKIPKPPNLGIYEIFKNTILNFSPQ